MWNNPIWNDPMMTIDLGLFFFVMLGFVMVVMNRLSRKHNHK